LYADAASAVLITRPEHFQVAVTENMFGDILSDLAGATVGGLGMCPSANIGDRLAYFEPIHGTAPDIVGKGIANPVSQIRAATMMYPAFSLASFFTPLKMTYMLYPIFCCKPLYSKGRGAEGVVNFQNVLYQKE
jgi:hypothetical protein